MIGSRRQNWTRPGNRLAEEQKRVNSRFVLKPRLSFLFVKEIGFLFDTERYGMHGDGPVGVPPGRLLRSKIR